MNRETSNAVRQILMNELGITRESIRAEVERLVADVVDCHIKNMADQGKIEKLVDEKFNTLLRVERANNRYDHATVTSLVVEAAKRRVEQFVKEQLRILPVNQSESEVTP